jgi:2,3-dihydroxyphenylpropionate 1,2-dioxygenase
MSLALICASHTPLMAEGYAPDAVKAEVSRAFAELATFARDFEPDYVIQFAPDHFNGFFYDLMPAFCVGAAAVSVGDWGTAPGDLNVPEDTAIALATQFLDDSLDVAVSYRMSVDHGFVQLWENTLGSALAYPIVPVFINCAAPPLPSFQRARLLGESAGRFALASGKKVLFAASGGLSHDPPTPQMSKADAALRTRLIDNRNPSEAERKAREQRVLAAGRRAYEGHGDILAVSEDWDRDFLARIQSGPVSQFDAWRMPELVKVAGRGGPEVLSWIAALAALSVAGPVTTRVHLYEAIQGWIAGMAMLTATSG